VVLTGTDLYRDIAIDTRAQASLAMAQRLVVLQACGIDALPEAVRGKARVIYQSTPARAGLPKPANALVAVMVGHMRAVKSPETWFEAARLLHDAPDIRLQHIGGEEEPGWVARAEATARECPNYRWLGRLAHEESLRHIAASHVLVHPSALEGGAHVILEAVRCGTPVLASRVPGNVGMLGADYGGYFAHGDAAALAALLRACRATQDNPAGGMLGRLRAQCAARDALFAPETERASLLELIHDLQSTP
jgi:putative glycosyltransferase (TIGR04348 family)